jgi:iron complex outermembrane recepter protein
MKVEVISVSKHDQTLSETAAAVFVISPEDIRHSGATNLPDLLRMVPGVYVAQINANTWAISIRGFNGRFSREVLVLVDGRTVYSPTFGGVFWDVLELPLTDLEKIEVVRGPGGSVWGTNAVNGVINIITKKASKTQGTLLEVGGGNLEQGLATLEHGGKIGESLDYRGFLSYQNNGSMNGLDGQPGADSWRQVRGGFRIDARLSPKDRLSVQGDLYSVRENQPRDVPPSLTSPVPLSSNLEANLGGGFLMSTWDHSFSARSSTTLLVSYQRYVRTDILKEASGNLDFDFQNNLVVGEHQQIVWGLGFRYIAAQDTNNSLVSILPPYRHTNRYSGFFQYQIDLASNRIHLTLGTKLEVNPYTGFAAMPTARIVGRPPAVEPFGLLFLVPFALPRIPMRVPDSTKANLPGRAAFPSSSVISVILNCKTKKCFPTKRVIVRSSARISASILPSITTITPTNLPSRPALPSSKPPRLLPISFSLSATRIWSTEKLCQLENRQSLDHQPRICL